MAADRRDVEQALLYAVLAMRAGFIDRARLIAAWRAWAAEPARGPECLHEALGPLDPEADGLVQRLARQHLAAHDDDARQSLTTLADPTVATVVADLEPLTEVLPGLEESLSLLAHPGEARLDSRSDRTTTHLAASADTPGTSDPDETTPYTAFGSGSIASTAPEPDGNGDRIDGDATTEAGEESTASRPRFDRNDGHRSSGSDGHDGRFTTPRFQNLRPLARGNLGEVSVAHDTELNREVALKQIRADHADRADSRARFLIEAEVTGGLEHPGVVPIYSLGDDGHGRPYYAMRLIRGESLRQAIRAFHEADAPGRDPEARNLELRQLLRRFIDVCNAIAYAHSRGVLHRDLKPANIMLGPFGETLVVDWGLAKPLGGSEGFISGDGSPASPWEAAPLEPRGSSEASIPGSIKGTPAYMSPEQAAGKPVGPPTDIYGLGATLYCLLVGMNPFPVGDATTVLAAVRQGGFVPPRKVNRLVPEALEAVCLKAMALKTEDRYPSARDLAEDVERWLADEPVHAYAEPLSARLGRWERRHRTLIRTGGAALLAIAAIMTVAAVNLNDAWRETGVALVQSKANYSAAETARGREQKAREEVEASSRQLRAVIDEFLDPQVDAIHMVPDSESLRLALADTNVTLYRSFLDSGRDDPSLPLQAARVFRRAANVRRLMGQDEPAGELYDEALALVEQPRKDDTNAHALLRVQLHRERAAWHTFNGRLRAALEDDNAALTELAILKPADPRSIRFHEAIARLDRAVTLLQLGDPAAAREDAARALARLAPIAEAPGARIMDRYLRVMAENALGSALHDLGLHAEAEPILQEAEKRARLIYRTRSLDPNVFQVLGSVLQSLARLRADHPTRLAEAADDAQASYFFRTTLYNLHREVPHYRRDFASTRNLRARIKLDRGDIPAAVTDAREALKVLDDSAEPLQERPDFLRVRAEAHAILARAGRRLGQDAAARFQLERALEAYRKSLAIDPDRWYDRRDLHDLLLDSNRVFVEDETPTTQGVQGS